MDPISAVLSAIRLDGAVYFNAEFDAPWCVEAGYGMPSAQLHRIGADHVIFFHCVVAGECEARLVPTGPRTPLRRGDLVLFPRDARHLLGSDVSLTAVDARVANPPEDPHALVQLRIVGEGPRTRFVCGYLACNRRVSRALLDSLPDMLVVPLDAEGSGAWLLDMMELAVQESAMQRPGAQSLLIKLSELLFTEALRRHCDQLEPDQPGWLAGLRDPLVGRALACLHQSPARPWSLDMLARVCGSSRSVLGERFRKLLGAPPMQYLASHRLALAAQRLAFHEAAVGSVALEVGYGSEAAFSRAFKREFGQAPALWRKLGAGGQSTHP